MIAERGIQGATVRDIGDAAGILSGSLYHHFESKDHIVLELLLPSVRANHDSTTAICAELSGLDAVAALIRDSILNTATHPYRSLILRNDARLFAELPALAPIAELRANILAHWIRSVDDGIEGGTIRPEIDAPVVVRAILDGTLGAARWFNGTHSVESDAIVDALVDFYIAGLRRI